MLLTSILLASTALASRVAGRVIEDTDNSPLASLLARQADYEAVITKVMTLGPSGNTSTAHKPNDQTAKRSTLAKRSVSYAVNRCPQQATGPPAAAANEIHFEGSACNDVLNPQAYKIRCSSDGFLVIPYDGACRSTEFCLGGIESANEPLTAYCIAQHNFIVLVQDQISESSRVEFVIPGTSGGEALAVENVLTAGDDITKPITAQSIQVEALAKDGSSLPGGFNTCNNCHSLGIQPFPEGLDHFQTTVVLNKGASARFYTGVVKQGFGF